VKGRTNDTTRTNYEGFARGNEKGEDRIFFPNGHSWEIQRHPKKILTDPEVIKILKRLEKLEIEVLTFAEMATSDYLEILQRYLPTPISKEEVEKWIRENIDFSKYKSRLKAIGPILKHFGGLTDGNTVKAILERI